MYRDLPGFVDALDRAGELVRVSRRVSAVLEIADIADRVSKIAAPSHGSVSSRRNDPAFCGLGGPALLFEDVEGSDFPVLINAFGSYKRMEMALGCSRYGDGAGFDEIGAVIAELVKPQPPRSLGEAFAKAKQFAPLLKIGPKRRRGSGASQRVVKTGDAVDLTRIPLIRCWPYDGDFAGLGYAADLNAGVPGLGHPELDDDAWDAMFRGRYITFAGIHTIHADDIGESKPSSHNIGMYRLQLLGKNRLAMHWHLHHDGARHWRSWKKRGEPMGERAAVLGDGAAASRDLRVADGRVPERPRDRDGAREDGAAVGSRERGVRDRGVRADGRGRSRLGP